MRRRVVKAVAEARVIKRYHRLVVPLIDLAQSLQDLMPTGQELGTVELTQAEGFVNIAYAARPRSIVINDGQYKFTLRIEDVDDGNARRLLSRPPTAPRVTQAKYNNLVPVN